MDLILNFHLGQVGNVICECQSYLLGWTRLLLASMGPTSSWGPASFPLFSPLWTALPKGRPQAAAPFLVLPHHHWCNLETAGTDLPQLCSLPAPLKYLSTQARCEVKCGKLQRCSVWVYKCVNISKQQSHWLWCMHWDAVSLSWFCLTLRKYFGLRWSGCKAFKYKWSCSFCVFVGLEIH